MTNLIFIVLLIILLILVSILIANSNKCLFTKIKGGGEQDKEIPTNKDKMLLTLALFNAWEYENVKTTASANQIADIRQLAKSTANILIALQDIDEKIKILLDKEFGSNIIFKENGKLAIIFGSGLKCSKVDIADNNILVAKIKDNLYFVCVHLPSAEYLDKIKAIDNNGVFYIAGKYTTDKTNVIFTSINGNTIMRLGNIKDQIMGQSYSKFSNKVTSSNTLITPPDMMLPSVTPPDMMLPSITTPSTLIELKGNYIKSSDCSIISVNLELNLN